MTTKARKESERCIVAGCVNRMSSATGVCPDHRPFCIANGCGKQIKSTNKYGYCPTHWHLADENIARGKTDKRRRQHASNKLMRTFGITLEVKEARLQAQGDCCAVCLISDPQTERGWQTDHDHTNGKIRGILCGPCNVIVGYVERGWPITVPEIEKYLDYWGFQHSQDETQSISI